MEFWDAHTPSAEAYSRQYRSAIFVSTEAEREAAERSLTLAVQRLGRPVHTAIEAAGPFWQAEDYHQKYRLKRDSLAFEELQAAYPAMDDLVRSTAAARANAWVADWGPIAQRERELPEMGLSEAAQREVRRRGR